MRWLTPENLVHNDARHAEQRRLQRGSARREQQKIGGFHRLPAVAGDQDGLRQRALANLPVDELAVPRIGDWQHEADSTCRFAASLVAASSITGRRARTSCQRLPGNRPTTSLIAVTPKARTRLASGAGGQRMQRIGEIVTYEQDLRLG